MNPNKTHSVLNLGKITSKEMIILEEIVSKIQKWDKNKPNNFRELREVDHVIYSFVNNKQNIFKGFSNFPQYEQERKRMLPILKRVTKNYHYSNGFFPRIMFGRLPAGKEVYPHVDAAPSAGAAHKIHIPIRTNPRTFFYVNKKPFHLERGNVYEVNNRTTHSVQNNGKTARIHLIFEYCSYDVLNLPS